MRRVLVVLSAIGIVLAFGCHRRTPAAAPSASSLPPTAAPAPSAPSVPPTAAPGPLAAPVPPAAAPAPPAPAPPPPVSAAQEAFASGETAMAEKSYEQALEYFASAWKESPGHPGVSKDFPEALTGLKKSADDAYRKGRLEEAGRRYAAAIVCLAHPAAKARPLPFTKADLQASLRKVSETLMERGLVEYRKGNLEAAIASWKAILAYDPSHQEAARSVQTATTQLKNLKKIPPPK